MKCPVCGSDQPESAFQCDFCRAVFSKLKPGGPEGQVRKPTPVPVNPKPQTTPLELSGWLNLGAGVLVGLLVLFLPFLNHIFTTLAVLIHEMGHAAAGWLLGCPSLPAFDFMYGGGVTTIQKFSPLMLGVIYMTILLLMVLWRRNRTTLTLLIIGLILHLLIALTPLKELVILFMGHGAELLIGGLFIYRAVSGHAILTPAERPTYGVAGFFLVFSDIRFASRLISSESARWEYGDAKGGGHWMDFDRIAIDILNIPLTQVAGLFLLCCLATPGIALLAHRYQQHLLILWDKLQEMGP